MDSRHCFEIRKYNHLNYAQPIPMSGPVLGETRASRELKELQQKQPLGKEELDAGWVYELNAVECPKMPRVRSSGKRR
jgi:hypothetical protein